VTTEEATEEPVAMTESTGVAAEDDHHGASQWESWAPAADATPTVATGSSDTAASVRRLLDDLANRIDRLIAPATLASREVDPDSLAEQLDRWSRPAPGSDDLLAAVQAVRKSPRDIDAVTRLADRAADLELLVRHYQAITTGSAKWAAELRQQKEPSGDES
jgi:hypothetical protein